MAIYKGGRGFELGPAENKSRQRLGRDLNSGPPNYKSSALTARPRFLHKRKSRNIPVLSIRVDLLRKQALLSEPHQDMDF